MESGTTSVVDWETWVGSQSVREFVALSAGDDAAAMVDAYLDAEPASGWLDAERLDGGDRDVLRERVRTMMIAEIERVL